MLPSAQAWKGAKHLPVLSQEIFIALPWTLNVELHPAWKRMSVGLNTLTKKIKEFEKSVLNLAHHVTFHCHPTCRLCQRLFSFQNLREGISLLPYEEIPVLLSLSNKKHLTWKNQSLYLLPRGPGGEQCLLAALVEKNALLDWVKQMLSDIESRGSAWQRIISFSQLRTTEISLGVHRSHPNIFWQGQWNKTTWKIAPILEGPRTKRIWYVAGEMCNHRKASYAALLVINWFWIYPSCSTCWIRAPRGPRICFSLDKIDLLPWSRVERIYTWVAGFDPVCSKHPLGAYHFHILDHIQELKQSFRTCHYQNHLVVPGKRSTGSCETRWWKWPQARWMKRFTASLRPWGLRSSAFNRTYVDRNRARKECWPWKEKIPSSSNLPLQNKFLLANSD